MIEPPTEAGRYDAAKYFALAECGLIAPDDRVELLEGLIVAMSPQSAAHAATVDRVHRAFLEKLGMKTAMRIQSTFIASGVSVPEPDIAVLPGAPEEYFTRLPAQAYLIVEVALSSLVQDRFTKAAIYARANIPCYWIVNLRDRCIEVFGEPEVASGRYTKAFRATGQQHLTIDAFPDIVFTPDELLLPH